MIRAPHSRQWRTTSSVAARAGPSGASDTTTVAGPTIVAGPDAISQVSDASAWTSAISLSLSDASSAAG